MSEKLVIDLPPFVDLPPDVADDQANLRGAIAAVLYKQGRLSPLQAQRLMGVTRREFEERLNGLGFTVMDDADTSDEIAAAGRLAKRQ